MKVAARTLDTWWGLHSWLGVISSLIVYVLFFFGAWTLFYAPLHAWEEARGPAPTMAQIDRALDRHIVSGTITPDSLRLNLPCATEPGFSINYADRAGERQHRLFLSDGALVKPRSELAIFLYAMHYLAFPSAPSWLYPLAGLAAATLVLVLVTGILIYLRHLVPRFNQFRPRRRLRVAWSDAHRVLGTVGVPFALVYAFTGAWLGLDGFMTTLLTERAFHGDQASATRARDGASAATADVPASGVNAGRLPLADLVARAHAAPVVPGRPPAANRRCRWVYLNHTGDRDATARFLCSDGDVLLRQRDGAPVRSSPAGASVSARIKRFPNEFHFVAFAGTPLRVLYALLALSGCITILTGNWLWLARRRPGPATWVVQRLTIAVGGGSLVATAAMLLGNRLGVTVTHERSVFWLTWLAATLFAAVPRDGRFAWPCLLAVGGAGMIAAPLFGSMTFIAGRPPWWTLDPRARLVDVALAALGLALLALASGLLRSVRATPLRAGAAQRAHDVA